MEVFLDVDCFPTWGFQACSVGVGNHLFPHGVLVGHFTMEVYSCPHAATAGLLKDKKQHMSFRGICV